jgi:hypothetical protein
MNSILASSRKILNAYKTTVLTIATLHVGGFGYMIFGV